MLELERRSVVSCAVDGCRLACHELDHHADGHAGGKAVRVEDNVGREARVGERQILGWVDA